MLFCVSVLSVSFGFVVNRRLDQVETTMAERQDYFRNLGVLPSAAFMTES
jgi:hypothetical protein